MLKLLLDDMISLTQFIIFYWVAMLGPAAVLVCLTRMLYGSARSRGSFAPILHR